MEKPGTIHARAFEFHAATSQLASVSVTIRGRRRRVMIVGSTIALLVVLGLIVFAVILAQRAGLARMPDDGYVAAAKETVQGRSYFRRFPFAACSVERAWNVAVNCDYPQRPPLKSYLERFRVQLDPETAAVLSVDIQTNAP